MADVPLAKGMADSEALMLAGSSLFDAYRHEFRRRGPRHAQLDRWTYDLGWNISAEAALTYLDGENG